MSEEAIQLKGITKIYRIWKDPRSRLSGALARRVGELSFSPRWLKEACSRHYRDVCQDFFALNKIDLSVKKGETVGIIGRNGSGKSTVLKIIAGTVQPSGGRVQVKGRIAALLELASGFNAQFTGRENVYLSGSILGLSKKQIDERFKDITDFADIGSFIDQPVKTYSSGMMVRLAFAVHTVVEPDILIIDEALSVGDAGFRRKCFSRLEQLRERGTTILFVSHDMGSVINFCEKAYFLHGGEVVLEGDPDFVAAAYQRLMNAKSGTEDDVIKAIGMEDVATKKSPNEGAYQSIETLTPIEDRLEGSTNRYYDPGMVPESTMHYDRHGAEIIDERIEDELGEVVNILRRGYTYRYAYRVRFDQDADQVSFAMLIKTTGGQQLGGARTLPLGIFHEHIEAGSMVDVGFKFECLLAPGYYFVNSGVEGELGEKRSYLDRVLDAAMFRVENELHLLHTGIIDFRIQPTMEIVEKALV